MSNKKVSSYYIQSYNMSPLQYTGTIQVSSIKFAFDQASRERSITTKQALINWQEHGLETSKTNMT